MKSASPFLAILLTSALSGCSFEVDGATRGPSSRYEVIASSTGQFILLETSTGRTWYSLTGEEWRPCSGGPQH